MQTFVTKTETATETKKLQSRRNLFGLGVTSLIAACAADESTGGSKPETKNEPMTGDPVDPLPFEAVKAKGVPNDTGGFTPTRSEDSGKFIVEITGNSKASTLTFGEGTYSTSNGAKIHKLTTANQYDLVASLFKAPSTGAYEEIGKGRVFIFWNVEGFADGAIDVDNTNQKRLEIKGAERNNYIGRYAPEFLHIGGKDKNYDMVIRVFDVNKPDNYFNAGAIYILWDVADYKEETKTIDLDPAKLMEEDEMGGTLKEGATSGSLAVYGTKTNDQIGTYAPEFLQIRGEVDNYDMVIRSNHDGKDFATLEGAIYILWDVAKYANNTSSIDLNSIVNNDATFGSLTIYGARPADHIGTSAPKFLQIGGEDNNYDMVIGAHLVSGGKGAIYILWDVVDYYSPVTDKKNKSIDLTPADATSGLLTIYGAYTVGSTELDANKQGLGNNVHNILYKDGKLTNIDKDDAGTIDIAITDKNYTYVFFGDKIAANNDAGTKVLSKTINLATVNASLTDSTTADFFGYSGVEGNLGYRFAQGDIKTSLEDVEGSSPFSSLSDADADLGVWDIA